MEVNGYKLAVVISDSSVFSSDNSDNGKLWLGRRSIDASATELANLSYDRSVLLMHHPLHWLDEIEQANIRASIRKSFDFLLHGHLHTPDFESAVSPQGALTTIAAGALYQGLDRPNRASIVSCGPDAFEIAPLRYEDSPNPQWVIDPSFFPSDSQYYGRFPWKADLVADALPNANAIEKTNVVVTGLSEARPFESELFTEPKSGESLYVEPRIRDRSQEKVVQSDEEVNDVAISTITDSNDSFLVSTRSEYGATTLAKRIAFEIESGKRDRAAYKDCRTLPNYRKKLAGILDDLRFTESAPGILVLDNFDLERDEKLLNELASLNRVKRLVVLNVERGIRPVSDAGFGSLPYKFELAFLWQISRNDIRSLAGQLFDTADQELLSRVVNKVYQDLLDLKIPLTPVTVIMYLRVLLQESSYSPLNRVDIMDRYLRETLSKPTDAYAGSFSFRNRMDLLSSLAKTLDDEGLSTFDEKFWYVFCTEYMRRTLTEFNADALLGELSEARVFLRYQNVIVFRLEFYFTFFVGRYYAVRPRERLEFILGEKYLRSDVSVVDVMTGLTPENTDVIEVLVERLEAVQTEFADKYSEVNFDPMLKASWVDNPSENEQLWEPVAKRIEAGPREAKEIDQVKSSMLAEARTGDQQVKFADFTELERKIFAVAASLRDAVRNSDDLDADLKVRAVSAVLRSELVAYQMGMIFSPIIARTNLFIWGAIAFVDFQRCVAEEKIDTTEGRILIADDITLAVAIKAADDIGTKKLGPVFKRRATDSSITGFNEFVNSCCLLYARSNGWSESLETVIRRIDKNSYYLYAMLRFLLRFLSMEIGTAGDREKAKRLVAVIRSKRNWGKNSPGERAVSKMLEFINRKDSEKKDGS